MSGEIGEDGDPGGGHEGADDRIQDDCRLPAAGRPLAERSGEDAGRKRQERGGDEDQQVDPIKAEVDVADACEECVVVEPNDADVDEGDGEGAVVGERAADRVLAGGSGA